MVITGGRRESDVKYVAAYQPEKKRFERGWNTDTVSLDAIRQEVINTGILEQIRIAGPVNFRQNLDKILAEGNDYFAGYKNAILEFEKNSARDKG
jgi:hypothetical protein